MKLSKVHNNKGYLRGFGPLIRRCIALSSLYVIFLGSLVKGLIDQSFISSNSFQVFPPHDSKIATPFSSHFFNLNVNLKTVCNLR